MQFGIIIGGDAPVTMDPADHFRIYLKQVRAAREAGFTYLLMGQHFLFRAFRWLQPVPTLARLAAEADGMWLATQIIIVPLYHPVILAEELATLDVVTNGRLIFGAGLGYRPEEFDTLGIPLKGRVARFEEAIELIKLLWSQPEVTFQGRYWRLDHASTHIRPVQVPRPPIWIGAQMDAGVRRSARLGDAWPITPETNRELLRHQLAIYREERVKVGKPVGKLPIRRNIAIAKNKAAALEKYKGWALEPMLAYARSGHLVFQEKSLIESFDKVWEDRVILGSPDECIEQLRALAKEFPVDPIVFKCQWPSMSEQEVIETVRLLGREIVPALRDL